MKKVSIIIPAYNEEEGLKKTVKGVIQAVPDAEIILVDDGSRDNTWKIMEKLSKEHKNIKSYRHKKNKGKASALKTGFSKAKTDILGTIDSDYTYPPKYFPAMIKKMEKGYDLVVGSRFLKGFPKKYPLIRALANRLGALASSIILFHKITDVTTGLRIFNRKVANLPTRAKNLDFEAELTARVIKSRIKYAEVPITMKPRLGMSKLNLIKHIISFFIAVLRGAVLKGNP